MSTDGNPCHLPSRSAPACRLRIAALLALLLLWATLRAASAMPLLPDRQQLDAEVAHAMTATQARGLAIAVIDRGQVVHVGSHGERNAAGQPLQLDTIMYGASLTKVVFAWLVMQLVDDGTLDLDKPLAGYLDRPLPDYPADDRYGPWRDLAGDDRWQRLTARHLLNHASGFANFAFLEADGKLRFHFDPGSRYGYSGAGLMLLQFVIERGLGVDVGAALQRRVFDPQKMADTSLVWRPSFAANLADGWTINGQATPHDRRSRVRVAGSMDTTITDMARFFAALVRGDGLSTAARAELVRPQLPITTASQFPTLQAELAPASRRSDLAASIGLVVFDGPQGRGFIRGGHNDSTGNIAVCIERGQRCVVILSNDVRAEAAFPRLVQCVLGETGAPWPWLYGDMAFWMGDAACDPRSRRDPMLPTTDRYRYWP